MTDPRPQAEPPELLPCPFCGSEAKSEEVHPRSGLDYWTVTCYGCDSLTVVASGKVRRQAADRWNRRAAPSPQEEPTEEWTKDVSPEVTVLCKTAERFLGAQRANSRGMGAGSGMMNAAEDRARADLERIYDKTPRRFMTEAFARLHDALRLTSRRVPPPAPTTFSAFVATPQDNNRPVAHEILAAVAGMRKRGEMEQSLCWPPEELELLAMFAIDAKNKLASPPPAVPRVPQDTERLDWLDRNGRRVGRAVGYLGDAESWTWTDDRYVVTPADSLRAAIDAARAVPGEPRA